MTLQEKLIEQGLKTEFWARGFTVSFDNVIIKSRAKFGTRFAYCKYCETLIAKQNKACVSCAAKHRKTNKIKP
jgi:hypothetical protein